MKNKLFVILIFFLIVNSCGRNSKVDFSQAKIDGTIIVDLSRSIKFDKSTDHIKIKDKDYLSEISNFLIKSNRKSKILIQSKHGERFLLEIHSSYGSQIKDYFIHSGVSSEKIESNIGFDFGRQYSMKFSDSRVVLLII